MRTIGYHWAVEEKPERIVEGGVISQPSCFFKRDAYDAIGGLNADLHYTMDWDLWIRLFKSGVRFKFIDQAMSVVLWAEGTKTSSFNAQRRAELARLIETHAPKEKSRKIMRSFAIHNVMERIPVPALKSAVARTLIRGRKEIYGISGDGLLTNGARLFIAHYDDMPKQTLAISAEGVCAIEDVKVNGAPGVISSIDKNAISVEAAAPIEPAEMTELTFALRTGKHAYLKHARWR